MKTNRKELVEILGAINCGLAAKEVVENSTCFIFTDGRVLTYNDAVAISHPVTINLEGSIKGKELLALLQKIPDEEVEFDVIESVNGKPSQLRIKYGQNRNAHIRLEENSGLEEILGLLGKPRNWEALPETFRPSIDFCLFSVGKDPNRPMLTSIFCGLNFVLSSDDNRITMCDLGKPEDVNLRPFCLPSSAAKELKAFLPVEYAFTEGWVHFRTRDDVTFSSRLLMGEYPWEKAKEYVTATKGELVKLPNGLIDTLDRTGIFTNDRVHMELNDGFLKTRGEGDSGSCEEVARVRYHGNPVSFEVDPEFLKQILQHTTEVVIGQSLLSFSGLGFTHVMSVKLPTKSSHNVPEKTKLPDDEIPW